MEQIDLFAPFAEKFFERDPAGGAHYLETVVEEDAIAIVKALPPHLSAKAFPYLQDHLAAVIMRELPTELFHQIAEKLDPQQGAGIFMRLPDEVRKGLLEHMPEKLKREIQELLTYPEDSAGRLMSVDFIAFHTDVRVQDVIQKIRQLAQTKFPSSYVYVINRENHLVGVINMRDLMIADPQQKLDEVMRKEVFTVNCFEDREQLALMFQKRKYFAAPVVDNENRLLGIIKAEQLLGGIQEEAMEDIQRMFGAGGDERVFSPVSYSLKKRLPWLHVNLATAFLAASVVALFEGIIAKITVLAVYLPVVAGQGGNAGAQSLAVVMRGLVMREIPAKKVRQLIFKESLIGLVNGLVIGVVTSVIAWFWQGNPFMGLVIGLGMVVNLVIAGFAGSAIPLAMKGMGLDPAQCSNIILTTVTDVMGFFAFLGFAVLFQNFLI